MKDEFDKNLRTSQCMGGGIEVETTVVVDGKAKQIFKKYDLNVPEAVAQFKKDFAEYRQEPESKAEYEKEVRLQTAYEIIGNLDDTAVQTVWLDKAIKKLQDLKHVRENIPF